jgi:chemotaxis-related protein WspB
MLLLTFSLGSDRYAVDATQVVEILPLATTKKILRAPEFVVGLLDYRGTPVPVIDLCQLTLGQSYRPVLSTRIVLVAYPVLGGNHKVLGVIAEKVTETFKRSADDFNPSGVRLADAPYLGPVLNEQGGMVQIVEVNALLPPDVQAMLFPETHSETRTGTL